MAGKYDYRTPSSARIRVEHLINWWRHSVEDSGDDQGSITAMCDILERVLRESS